MVDPVELLPRTITRHLCGFLQRAKGHSGDFTCGSGTFCSECHQRVFNPYYRGALDVESDMEIIARLRRSGVPIPEALQKEISEYQDKVDWKPRWKW